MWLSLLPVLLLLGDSGGSRILAVLPLPVYSHTVPFFPVLDLLAERGHEVTLISPFRNDNTKVHNIQINFTLPNLSEELTRWGVNLGDPRSMTGLWYETSGLGICSEISQIVAEQIKPVLPDPRDNHFDLLIGEFFFCQESVSALGHMYNTTAVSKHPGPIAPSQAYLFGNPTLTSYTPHVRLVQSDQMNLLERTWNFLITTYDEFVYNALLLPKLDASMREVFSDMPNLPYVKELLQRTALLMTETHFALNYPRPFAKNILEIGGMGINDIEPLPKDLAGFLNDSEAGVIYFSWGSHFKSEDMNGTLSVLMDVFSQLEQRVLFKWYTDLPDKPSNVLVREWFPQNAVLSHEKVLLYMSHCGLNSIYEAGYHGVPVVATPLFVDQPHNALILKEFGMAEVVDFESLNDRQVLLNAIRKVLTQPSYRENARKRSGMMKERPVPVLSEIVSWLEYVMKYGGDHMRPAASSITWYSLYQLDVIILVEGLITVLVTAIVFLIARILRLYRSLTSRPPDTIKKQQ